MNVRPEYGTLSEREEQVLLLSTKGLTDKEIAKKLGLSIATVNTYWVRIRTKLGGANRAELVAAALQMNAEETLTAKELENQRLIAEIVRRAEAEKALRDHQERLQAIIDGTPVNIYVKDTLGRYMLVNKGVEQFFGLDRKDILGKRDVDLFPYNVAEKLRHDDRRVLDTGEPYESLEELPDGSRTFLTAKFALVDSDGNRYAICGFSQDITHQLQQQAALESGEERYRQFFQHNLSGVLLVDDDGNAVDANPAFCRMIGLSREELLGKNLLEFAQPLEDDLRIEQMYHEFLRDGKWEGLIQLRRPDRREVHAEWWAKRHVMPGLNFIIARDVTQEREARAALEASEERFRKLIENSTDMVTLIGQDGEILYSSPPTFRLLGYKPEEVVGTNVFTYFHPIHQKQIYKLFKGLQGEPGATVEAVSLVRHADGSWRWMSGTGKNLVHDNGVEAIVLNYRDVSERKLDEQRLAAQYEVVSAMAEGDNLAEVLPKVCEALGKNLDHLYCGIWLRSKEDQKLELVATWTSATADLEEFLAKSREMRLTGEKGLLRETLHERKPRLLPDLERTKGLIRLEPALKAGLRCALAFPIYVPGEAEALGVVECFGDPCLRHGEDLLKTLDSIGGSIGQFLHRVELQEELKRHNWEFQEALRKLHWADVEVRRQAVAVAEAKAEVELERRRFQALFEEAPDGYLVTDLEGEIQAANQAACRLLGRPKEDVVGQPIHSFVAEGGGNPLTEEVFRRLEERETVHEYEAAFSSAEGGRFDAAVTIALVRSAKGEAEALRWLIRDISRRKWAENELKAANEALERRARIRTIELEEANERLREEVSERKHAEHDLLAQHELTRQVIEHNRHGVIAFDRECRCTEWNRAMEKMMGIPREDVIGRDATDILPFLADIGEDTVWQRVLSGETVTSQERPFAVTSTDSRGYFDAYYTPIRNERNEVVGGLGLIEDVTDRVRDAQTAKVI
jgi:PAS domain S-box-containing protein